MIMSGCDDNVFEYGTVDGVAWGIYFTNNQEDSSTDTHSGDNNIFRNIIFSNCNRQIALHSDSTAGGTTSDGTKLINCTFYNPSQFAADISEVSHTMTNWTATNCIIDDVATAGAKIGSISFNYTDIWNSWATSIGTNSVNINPNYVNAGAGNFEPQATFASIDAPRISGAEYDSNGLTVANERDTTTTIGAVKHADETVSEPPAVTEFYPTGDAASKGASEANDVSQWTTVGQVTVATNADSNDGSWSVEVLATGTAYERITLPTAALTAGQQYTFTWDEKLVQGSHCRVVLNDADGSTQHFNHSVVSGTWASQSEVFTAVQSGAAQIELHAVVNDLGAVGDGFLFDTASIVES
jgi:hypothetical protein